MGMGNVGVWLVCHDQQSQVQGVLLTLSAMGWVQITNLSPLGFRARRLAHYY